MPTRPYQDVAELRRARMSVTGRAQADAFAAAAQRTSEDLSRRAEENQPLPDSSGPIETPG